MKTTELEESNGSGISGATLDLLRSLCQSSGQKHRVITCGLSSDSLHYYFDFSRIDDLIGFVSSVSKVNPVLNQFNLVANRVAIPNFVKVFRYGEAIRLEVDLASFNKAEWQKPSKVVNYNNLGEEVKGNVLTKNPYITIGGAVVFLFVVLRTIMKKNRNLKRKIKRWL